ncbi:TonB-dependent receptor plug domain-containing protein [Microbulbifer sp. SH-1]|uniref:TonB-dependent receptor n=1 Tax=Microbulbifer sp. SH-1 TaxID=2681547 RepID=UPI00140BD8DD|nr:TonB-dependent receptor [Microbulbifer sp. SH-1]QIL91011.1 TonB-dependent receptor plug domain-containing protein [Microbulbifer sp. SH-1]
MSLALVLSLAANGAIESANPLPGPVNGEDLVEEISVLGRQLNLNGEAISASQGEVGPAEIGAWPLIRTGDLMEFVPGMVATQHSGSGKANQYFLRGFNLDHGTDFATFVDGMPVNLRTHGHGQGYTDLNFVIPETVARLRYRKGPYYADVGDFSSAGSASFMLAEKLSTGLAELSVGEHGYRRGVAADSVETGSGDLLLAAEWQAYDGPWSDIREDVGKVNLLGKLSGDLAGGRAHLTLMGYDNAWNSPDQIPARAVAQGAIDAYGSLDTSLGGDTRRYSLSGGWNGAFFRGELAASAYAVDYDFNLWSNFTYGLEHPDTGDQFLQRDARRIYGFDVTQQWQREATRWQLGLQGRRDDIDRVGLYHTADRERLGVVREDAVVEDSLGLFAVNQTQWSDTLRSYLGLRYDRYAFDVNAGLVANSGRRSDGKTSLKASLAWQPWPVSEFYLSYGQGLHSNDARGTVIKVDPLSGETVDPVDPLVESRGAELGSRLFITDQLHATLALWQLDLDSELLFVGDAGNTEASRPSERKGVEAGIYWFASERVSGELEVSYTDAAFADSDPAGGKIPGAIPLVASAALNYRGDGGWFAALHLRHFGAYPLIEDGGVESAGSSLVNLRLGREVLRWRLQLDLLNALDSDDHDVDYFYASRLPGESADGVEDTHFHIFEPRTLRASLRYRF